MTAGRERLEQIRARLAAGAKLANALEGMAGAEAENANGFSGAKANDPVLFTGDLVRLAQAVRHELLGAGATIAPLLEDPRTTDVIVNGAGAVWKDQGRGMEPVDPGADPDLASEQAVRALAVRLAAQCGQRLDDASPIVDGTFPSGVRLHALIPPLSASGTLISLRTHRSHVLSVAELVATGSIPAALAGLVQALVVRKANVMISGATGAGKTTFLNSMLSLVPANERIIVIEEAAELAPRHPHVVHLQVRRPNVQGVGEISMSELVKAAMRMRPDRIVLGECRGAEVRDVLGALNTGHEGGWATIHANSAHDVPARLVALGALANMAEATVAAQAAAGLDAVIHIKRSGARRAVCQIGVFERKGGELICPNAFLISDAGTLGGTASAGSIAQMSVGADGAGGRAAPATLGEPNRAAGSAENRKRAVAPIIAISEYGIKLCQRLGVAVPQGAIRMDPTQVQAG